MQAQIGQYVLNADARPLRGADKRGANAPGNTAEGDVLVKGFPTGLEIVNGEHHWIVYQRELLEDIKKVEMKEIRKRDFWKMPEKNYLL